MLKRCFLFIAAISLFCSAVLPQSSTGSVRGTVRDQSEAVVPGVSVVLTNLDTNVSSKSTTNEVGFYIVPGLIAGRYRLTAEQTGFQILENTITVQVGQNVVIDPVLKPGAVSTTVVVQSEAPMVVTDSPALGHVLERRRIEQLPLNGRTLSGLLVTIPGQEGTRAYGIRDGSQEVILDGAATADKLWGGMARRQASLEAIEEFRVENNSSSAKFSRPTSIVASTRSGTNRLHGTLFETNRNNAYGKARRREDNYAKAPMLNRNEYGGSVGGPLYLPRIYDGKDRTFWFFAYEGLRQIAPSTMGFPVPTEAMRNGDFSGLKDSEGRTIKIYDPWTTDSNTWQRQQFAYRGVPNVIDPARMSPIAKTLFGITPLPTEPNVNPYIDNNWWGPVPSTRRQWIMNMRFDHRISEKDQIFGRYSQGHHYQYSQFYAQPMLNGVAGTQQTTAPNKTLGITHLHTFSPTFFNELLVSGNRELAYNGTGDPNRKYADEMGLPNPMGVAGWPGIYPSGLRGDAYYFETQNTSYAALSNVIIDDNMTKIKGRHEFLFGGHYRYDQMNYLPEQQQVAGNINTNSGFTSLYDPSSSRTSPQATPFTGNGIANLYLGGMIYSNQFVRNYFYARGKEYALYFQDNFRVTPRLTLNLGLRWEFWPSYSEKNKVMVSFDDKTKSIVLGQDLATLYRMGATLPSIVTRYQGFGAKFIDPQAAGLPPKLIDNYFKDFGPRLGLAYRAGDGARSFVVRGGYRISYFPLPLTTWGQRMRSNAPLNARFYNDVYSNAATSPDGIAAWGMRSVPTIIGGLNSKNAVSLEDPRSLSRGSALVSYFDRNQPDSRVQDWNLTLEKEVMSNTLLRVGYFGNHVDNLEQYYRYNENPTDYVWFKNTGLAIPGGEYAGVARRPFDQVVYGTIERYQKSGWSNSNGMQFELERRFSKGFSYQLFYVVQNVFTAGGRSYSGVIPGQNIFLTGTVPTDLDALNRLYNYQRDTTIPKHRVRWNWVADLPFGKGKNWANNLPGFLDKIVGGWQISGMGTVWSSYYTLPATQFQTATPIETYGYKYPIQDCRSGACRPGYLYWNGYINPNQINSVDASGKPNGVMGVPSNYKPSVQPLNPWPVNPSKSDPMYAYYGTNTTWVTLKNGVSQRTTFDNGLMPLRQQYRPGVRSWMLDASLVKTIPFNERFNLRFQLDAFNVLNHPGNSTSITGEGLLMTNVSGQAAREMQLSLRLNW